MADGIKISLGQVSSTAAQIRSLNAQLMSNLTDIKAEMNNLGQTWESDAANSIIGKFNGLQSRFDNYNQVVNNYAKFLDDTVTSYDSTETKINSAASEFK